MLTKFFYSAGVCVVLMMFTASCRQPIDLDTDRTVVPTNLPEITDFSPKAGWMGDRITITGKNFVNVQKVMMDTLTLDSVVVESPNQISAYIPYSHFYISDRIYKLSVVTKLGIAESKEVIGLSNGSIAGFVSFDSAPLDNVILVATHSPKNWTGQAISGRDYNMKSSGFYAIQLSSINTGVLYSSVINGAVFNIRPFLSGYTFTPTESNVLIQNLQAVGNNEFKAKAVPAEKLPEVTSVTPNAASSFSGGAETGTDVVLRGKGFAKIQKVMLGISYPSSPGSTSVSYGYAEATTFTIDGDNQLTIRLPRLDRTKTVSGKTYTNCQIYLLTDEGSLLAPQRISITYI